MIYPDGREEEGKTFSENSVEGLGKRTYKNGRVEEGRFEKMKL
jgi:antitoxin component YwqK of YwqJK toxin-antitoxin module